MTAGGGAQKLLESHAGAESMRFVVLASKIKVRRAWDTLDVEGQPGVASGCSQERGVAGHGACGHSLPPMAAASDCAHHRRRTTAWTRTRSGGRAACSACTHWARTPWPLRRRRARAPTLTVIPNPNPNPSPNTNPKPNTNQASPSSLGRRGACVWLPRPMPMAMRPNRLPLIETVRSVCATSWFSLRFCLKPL